MVFCGIRVYAGFPYVEGTGKEEAENDDDTETTVTPKTSVEGPLTAMQVDEAREKLCRWLYSSATAFTAVEDKHFREFVTLLRPYFVPPSRFDVANKYLDREKARLEAMVRASLKGVGHCTLSTDGADDGCKEQVSHVCALTPAPHFLGSLRFGTDSQTAERIVEGLEPHRQAVEKLGVQVVGIISDNEAKMRAARQLFHERFGGCKPGCGPHAGNLITGDVLKLEDVKDTLTAAKTLGEALKNTKLRSFLKDKLGVGQDHRIGVPMAGMLFDCKVAGACWFYKTAGAGNFAN